MSRLFVDLDGVLADFDAGAERALGMACGTFVALHGEAVMWKRLAATPDYFRLLPWTQDGLALWDGVTGGEAWSGPAPMILTGLPRGDWAEPQKRAWCREALGTGVAVICCLSIDKARYCSAGDILIDDRESARLDWEAAGGRFVHHVSAERSLAALRALAVEAAMEE